MTAKLCRLVLCSYSNSCKYQTSILNVRSICIKQALFNKEKLTIKLIPDVENLLETGEVKHRKHPGIRKIDPISVPKVLATAAEKLISGESEKALLEKAKDLCNRLTWRRTPVEKEDIDKKVCGMFPEFEGDYEELPHVLNKSQLKELRKRINLEIGKWKTIEYNYYTCLAYLVGRLSANYASVSHVFDELVKHEPTFKPETFFDFGSGVGSALWAAHSHWSDSLKEYFCVDISPDMNTVCESLITDEVTEQKYMKPVFFRQFLPASSSVKYDLVVSAFSLLELENAAERLKTIDILWQKTNKYLVIVEHGSVAGFNCVLDARDFILKIENDSSPQFANYNSGAHVVSPCPHDLPCPKFLEKASSSCGFFVPYHPQFPQRYSHVVLKDWISYVILKKSPRPSDCEILPRIVKPVLKRPKHVVCRLCCSDGQLKEVIVTKAKHGRHAYRVARASNQGDILCANINPAETSSDTE